MAFGAELPFFHSAPGWDGARRVVDLGCGNGAFTHRLAAAFPHVGFVAVDTDEELIAIAQRDFAAPNVRYHAGTVTEVEGSFDAVVSRFCLLYAPGLDEIQRWVGDHVGRGILQIDNEDDLLLFPPSLARFESTLNVTRIREREGAARTAEARTAPLWAAVGFDLAWTHVQVVSSEEPFSRDLMHRWLIAMGEVGSGGRLPPELEDDLSRWHSSGDYLQYAVRASWYLRR